MAALSPLECPTLKFPITELLARIRAEYVEMPGLKLTTPQARRLWGLDGPTCDAALAALVQGKFLFRTPEGLFVMAATQRSEQEPRSGSGRLRLPLQSALPGVPRSDATAVRRSRRGDPLPSRKSA